MNEKNIKAIIAGLEEHMVVGEVIRADGEQVMRVMRLYELKFYAYPDLTDDIMSPEYKGNILGAPVDIRITPRKRDGKNEE